MDDYKSGIAAYASVMRYIAKAYSLAATGGEYGHNRAVPLGIGCADVVDEFRLIIA